MLLLPACGMPGQTEDPNEEFWGGYYGTAKSEENKEKDWWGSFYGTSAPKEDASCSFYGTCKSKTGAASGSEGGGGHWSGGLGPSDSGSDAGGF